jgi:probable lipoprotein NlpC
LSFRDGLQYTIPRTSEAIYNWAQNIPTSELQPGDLVFFVTVGTRVSHLGIYTGGGRFIHSASEGPHTGVIYSRLDESYWRRTFRGAGRALPWDELTGQAMAAARPGGITPPGGAAPPGGGSLPVGTVPVHTALRWTDPGYFVGFGAAWIWGGGAEGMPSAYRGFSALATAGYKWPTYRIGLELRPQFDSSLGVFRLPLTVSLGTDQFRVFAGPAFVFGEPVFELSDGERRYDGGLLWELGLTTAFRPLQLGPGALSRNGLAVLSEGRGTKIQIQTGYCCQFEGFDGSPLPLASVILQRNL